MKNKQIERSQYKRAPPKEVQAAEDLLIQPQASLRRQKADPHVELSGPRKKVKVGLPPSVISSPGSSTSASSVANPAAACLSASESGSRYRFHPHSKDYGGLEKGTLWMAALPQEALRGLLEP